MTLPRGWEKPLVGDLCHLINGKAFKPSDWSNVGLPIIRIQNLNRTDAEYNYCDKEIDARFIVESGELLFAWSGTPGTSFGAHIWNGPRAVLNQHIFRVRFDETLLDRDFFKLAINSTLDELISKAHGGVGLAHVTKGKFEATALPIPPLAEQRRIVAKLGALTARLSRTRVELDRVPLLARRLRERAVRLAFAGELTEGWRNEQAITTTQNAPDLPHGWVWLSLGQLADIKSGLTLGKKRPTDAVLLDMPYLRVANVQRGSLDLSIIKLVPATTAEAEALRLEPGDILLNEGGDRDKLGRGWVWQGEIPGCIHQNHVFRARLRDPRHSPFYVSLYANEFGQDYFLEHGTQTTNLASISKAKLSALPVPMAPSDEQQEIVKRLGAIFAHADRLEAEASRARALLDRLESAVLAKAFRGELVAQDPNDEPASVLLDRIRAQRAAAPKPTRGRHTASADA